jgi:hypothetical protein
VGSRVTKSRMLGEISKARARRMVVDGDAVLDLGHIRTQGDCRPVPPGARARGDLLVSSAPAREADDCAGRAQASPAGRVNCRSPGSPAPPDGRRRRAPDKR